MIPNPQKIAMRMSNPTQNAGGMSQQPTQMPAQEPQELRSNVDFYVVNKPMDHTPKVSDLVQQHNPLSFAKACNEGSCRMEEVAGCYMDEAEAHSAAYEMIKELYSSAKSLEEKKEKVSDKLQKKIDQLDREAQKHLKLAKQEPDNKEKHRASAKALLDQIEQLESKHKMVSGSKKELQPLDEFEMPKAGKKEKK